MRLKLLLVGVLAFALTVLAPLAAPRLVATPAFAQTVTNIVVQGNQRVEPDTVISYLQLGRGDAFSAEKVDESIKALFQTGLFSDVRIARNGGTMVINVVENPLINVVNFEGNSEITDDALAKEVEVRERMIFTKARVQSDTQRILDLYQRSGFYNVRVAPKLIRLPENRVNLVFEITESGKTHVTSITFSGNNSFGASELRGVIGTKQKSWWNFMQRNDIYDPDRVEYDKELLRRFYLKNGFADVQVDSANAQLSPSGDSFTINFNIIEGQRYKVADVAVNVGDADLEPDPLRAVVKTGVGDNYDASKVDKTVDNLALEASRQGFVFAKVDPQINRDANNGTLGITYNISEGQRTYIERIDITGNSRTLDEVIRRELQLYEGDAFNRVLVERARRRLTALDFFDKVDFREEEGSAPDKVVLVVEVAEKATGKISFSIGYSSVEALIGTVELSERNFRGRGQDVRINTALSFKKQQVDFSFTEPYFMGMPISAGFDLFATNTDNTDYSSYKSRQIGGALRTGFRLDEYSSVNFKYYLAYRKVTGVDVTRASPTVIKWQGSTIKSAVSGSYVWDDLDNPMDPNSGLRAQLDLELAGLGGDTYYGALEAHAWYFIPIVEDAVTLKLEGNAGHMQGIGGHDVPLQDRFFKGADSFRGFAKSGIGPMQVNNAGGLDSIGAQTYAIGTVEATFPIGAPEAWGMSGAVFSDFGTVFNAPETTVTTGDCTTSSGTCTVYDSMAFRASVGAGIIWKSPFGPLRFDLAYPVLKQKTDNREWFRFSIGTRF
jgi:outer membrane protein insertion porin family